MIASGMLTAAPFGFEIPLPIVALGVLTGVAYGLMAVGLVLIYRASRIINFAQGQIGAFGFGIMGLLTYKYHFPYYLALPIALASGGAIAGQTEALVIRRLERAPRIMSIVATLGVGAFLATFAQAVNPVAAVTNVVPTPPGMPTFELGGLLINQAYSAVLILGPIAVVGLTVFLRWSRTGLGMRGASANPESARMAGISTSQMTNTAWVIAGVLSTLTAVLVIPASGVSSITSFGPTLLLRALAAGAIARMSSLPIAFGAGIAIGVVEQLLIYNYPNSSNVSDLVLYALILLALLLPRARTGREGEKGSWAAIAALQPLPRTVSRLPEIKALRWSGATAALIVALVLPMLVSNSSAQILTTILAFSVIGLSLGIVTGLSGQLSLGQFGIATIGAIVAFHVGEHASFAVALLCAGVTGSALSLVIGAPALRLRGLMLTVTTLGFALVVSTWGLSQTWAFSAQPRPLVLFGHTLDTGRTYYFVALAVFLVSLFFAWNTRRLGLGRALAAVRDNESNARAFTFSANKLKLQSFMLAGFFAGVGGALYGFSLAGVDAVAFPLQANLDIAAMAVIGGMSILLGPLLGALYIIGLPRFLPLQSAALAATQLGWLLLILAAPGGLAQGYEYLRDRTGRWAARRHDIDFDAPPDISGSKVAVDLAQIGRSRHAVPTAGTVLLEARDLRCTFGGVVAVDSVDLSVCQGEIVGLIGPNGAGKTTTFEMLSGFTRPDRGKVIFNGTDVSRMAPEQRARLGLIRSFQDAALFPSLTVEQTLQLAFEPRYKTHFLGSVMGLGGSDRAKQAHADDLIDLMGLGSYARKQVQQLSTGTRRITELACVVALSPILVLLDEPSSGVAQKETEALTTLLCRLKQELDLTMLVIEHDIPMIMTISDRVIAMDVGAVIADATPEIVQSDPRVISAYLGSNEVTINRSGTTTPQPATRRDARSGAAPNG